jgi:hypothetical protein
MGGGDSESWQLPCCDASKRLPNVGQSEAVFGEALIGADGRRLLGVYVLCRLVSTMNAGLVARGD